MFVLNKDIKNMKFQRVTYLSVLHSGVCSFLLYFCFVFLKGSPISDSEHSKHCSTSNRNELLHLDVISVSEAYNYH